MTQKITVFGAGAFGTAAAHTWVLKGHNVLLWAREGDVIDSILKKRENIRFLPGIPLEKIAVTGDLSQACQDRDVFVLAVPCQYLRDFLKSIHPFCSEKMIFVNLAKGIEIKTHKTIAQIFADVFGQDIWQRYATISGPTFAKEVCLQYPTAAAVAAFSDDVSKTIQTELSTKRFRLYRSPDVMGVELGGALKNIMAIAVGIMEGLGFSHNTRAGLITRCLREMMTFGEKMGALPQTFSGLSGIGDLMLTCYGDLSRNRQVGIRLGKGETLDAILKSSPHVAEGVPTAKAVYQMNQKFKLDMPNTEHVYKILFENIAPQQVLEKLLSRDLKDEF